MESFIRDAIHDHMISNALYSDKQFGFINARSTTLQMLHVLDIWTKILDQGGTLDVVYCDFMKAFDKVPHERLLHKIQQYGITGNILGWIKSFLANRTQQVCINNTLSEKAPVTSGIPQGSVLGPLLFVLYINDLPGEVDKDTFLYLFADDTKVFREIDSQADNSIIQRDINNLKRWSDQWLLKFHPQKCVSMTICNKSEPGLAEKTKREYHMGNYKLKSSDCEKDIGIHVDEHLSFDTHINYIANKANRVLAITRKSFEFMDIQTFKYLYKGLVRPQLEYATSVWHPHLIRQMETIEDVQIRATKMVPGLSKLTYPERLKKLDIPTLRYRRIRGDMIQMYKLICKPKVGAYDCSLPSLFEKFPRDLRGHDKKLVYDPHRLDIRKYSFKIRNIELWNSLPQHVIDSESIISFGINTGVSMKYTLKILKRNLNPTKLIKNWNWTKGPCQELLFKDQIAIKRGYSWGISPLPYYKTDQSTRNGTARVSPPYLLPLTLLCGGSIHPRRYSWGISPLPYYMTALSMREGTAGVSPPYLTAWQTSTTAACWSQSTGRILGHWSNTYCLCPRSPAGMHQ